MITNIHSFTNCWIIIKNLKNAFVAETQKYARKTTDFKNQNYVLKTFVELKFDNLKTYAIR